jgi:hypothetical protein
VLGFNEKLQVAQTVGPENAVLLDPRVDGAQGFGIQLVDAVAAFAVFANEVGAAQQAEMFRNRWTGDGKSAGDLPRGLAAAAEQIQNGASCRVGESLEGGLVGPGRRICNRTVTHNA